MQVELKLNLCLKCRRRLRTCICDKIQPFETNSRFLILMHPMEYKKEKVGTGRFSHLILKNSKIVVDINFDNNDNYIKYINDPEYESYLVYPGEQTIDLSKNEKLPLGTGKKPQFILIDGTWPCAKKMVKLTKSLHQLPRVSFKQGRISEFKIKHQPLSGCLSTCESLHQLIKDLNQAKIENTQGKEENIIEVFRSTIQVQEDLASNPDQSGYRRKAFRNPDLRRVSKKWSQRLLFYKNSAGQ